MKKLFYMGLGALITILALGAAGFVFAQSQNPATPQPPTDGETTQPAPGWGMMGGRMHNWNLPNLADRVGMMKWRQGFRQGMMGGYAQGFAQGMSGPMHEAMITVLAEKLGLTVEELQNRINTGESPFEIAKAQGLTESQVQELFEQAHDEALKTAVAAGLLTQEQADTMDQHMKSMWGQGRMNGWQMGGFRGQRMGLQGTGLLHDYMVVALAEAVDLTVDQVQGRLDAGETTLQIAQAQGLTAAQFQEKMAAGMKKALNKAVADGKLTQEQADSMQERIEQFGSGFFGRKMFWQGGCPGMGSQNVQP